jgi:parallel beta-helix repeat protein
MSQELVTPTDGMVITQDTRFAPGVYPLPNGITIGADGVTVEGEGAMMVSGTRTGVGVTLDGRRDVTLRGLSISGYYNGVRADRCRDVTVEAVRVRETAEVDGITTFLYLWTPVEDAYGGAILLHDVQGGAVRGCDLQHQMNGIMLYDCGGLTVERNNASFNSGWGVYLSGSSENVIQDNQLDFCNRVFRRPDGSVRVEADSAGIVLVYSSSRNQFLRNSCLCGGDGIFVAGYDHKGHQGPCNDNLFEDNDCRLSPNNAIEATFSRGNIFRRNDCSRSNFGLWMGYSWDNVVEDNTIEFSRWAGIAIEHGFNFTIRNNRIRLNNEGIRLWTRGGGVLPYWPGHEVCYAFAIEDNLFESNRTAFHGYTGEEAEGVQCHDFTLRGNTIRDNRIGVRFAEVHGCAVEGNTFDANLDVAVLLEDDPGVTVGDNTYTANGEDVRRAARKHDFQKNL